MTHLLFDHIPGCSPFKPCAACEIVQFLRGKLTADDFETFLSMAQSAIPAGEYSAEKPAPLQAPISILGMSCRSENCCKNSDISTIGELVKKTDAELLRMPNFGRRSLQEIKVALEKVGHTLLKKA